MLHAGELAAVPERGDGWRVMGPGGGGAMFCPAISPHDSRLLFLACDMTGAYVSRDAGATWRMFNLQEVIREFAFDASDAATIYARGNCLWVSRDSGRNWTKLLPTSHEAAEPVSVGDHADVYQFTRDGRAYRVTAFASDPTVSGAIHATVQLGDEQKLLFSHDGGRTWDELAVLPQRPMALSVDPDSPPSARVVIAVQANGLTLVHGTQRTEHPAPAGATIAGISVASDSAKRSVTIYAVTSGENSQLLVTHDRGARWEDISKNLTAKFPHTLKIDFRAVAASRDDASVLYVSFKGLVTEDGRARLGVARSDDGGGSWSFAWLDPVVTGPLASEHGPSAIAGWIDEHFGPDWGEHPLAMCVDPRDSRRVLATDFGRAVLTTDGGRVWRQTYTRAKDSSGWMSRGLDVTNVYGLKFDPFDAGHAYMMCTDIGLLRSRDGGESWRPATPAPGLPPKWENTTYALIFDPAVRGRVWAAMSGTHDLPREKMWRRRSPAAFDGGILLSEDGGEHWKTTALDVGEAAVTDLLLEPESPVTRRTLYACAFGRGVLKSSDGGHTWQTKNHGLDGEQPLAWRIYRRASDRALFLVVFRRKDAAEAAPDQIGAIYRSDDGAESWQRLSLPEGVTAPTSLAVENLPAGVMLLAAWGRRSTQLATGDGHGGIYRSIDDGRSWSPALVTDAHIATLTSDARTGAHYACGFNGKAYRSTNEGRDWQVIPGYDFKWGQRVEPDPQSPGKVFILTYGGGVWHGPVDVGGAAPR